jgi:Restriction endonuclease fold toxin 7
LEQAATGGVSSGFVAGACAPLEAAAFDAVAAKLKCVPLLNRLGGNAPNKMQVVRQLGQEGENAAGIVKNTQRIDALSGKAKYRIPDEITKTYVKEVKNVAKLDFTAQIRDSSHYAIEQGKDFILVVRQDTILSQPIINAVNKGWIILEYLP